LQRNKGDEGEGISDGWGELDQSSLYARMETSQWNPPHCTIHINKNVGEKMLNYSLPKLKMCWTEVSKNTFCDRGFLIRSLL
jgi:hypothetical protein